VRLRHFRPDDRDAVVALWQRCELIRPWNDPNQDIDRKLAVGDGGFLIGEVDGRVVATAMVGYDGHRGWVNYLAVDVTARGAGFGRTMMSAAEDWLRARGCPKVNLQVRATNSGAMAFYESLGFARDEVVSFGKRLVSDQ
jgi:ribosomal protein S18 acetylase RimI-like enzyme